MSARTAAGRLAAMDRQELRTRLICAGRKVAGRIGCAMRTPRWRRRDLSRILLPGSSTPTARAAAEAERGDFLAAHRSLGEHFATRSSCWPLAAPRVASLARDIGHRWPSALTDARARAERIIAGRYDLLGYRDVALGNPPDWHADAVHGRRAPLDYWSAIPYLNPALGDHKVIWETNRHQHTLALGRAFALTRDARYRLTFMEHLEDWLATNPPLQGVNWSSMLELAFRSLSWTWGVEFFAAGCARDETPWLVDLLIALDRQLTHIADNLSLYFSPNTHLTGEALALYAVSTAFPELRRSRRRATLGRDVLLREATRQVHPDGGHAELSPHYHRYSTDFYLLAVLVARAAGDPASGRFEEAARRQASYMRTLADDRGHLPLIGDDDGGQLFRFGGSCPAEAASSLAVAADVLSDSALAVGPPPEDAYWILGRAPATVLFNGAAARWPSRILPDAGYVVSRTADGGHFVFDAGPHGFLNGGHAHADALSVVLTVGSQPLLVDPGTATYTMDSSTRDRFRSSRMHNTVVLDGRDHAEPDGPFHWRTRVDATLLVARLGADIDFAVGTHAGYGPRRHLRAVLALKGTGWLIVDRIATDSPTEAEAMWHLHPAWSACLRDRTVTLTGPAGRRLALASTAHTIEISRDPVLAGYSPEYGRVDPATTLRTRQRGDRPFSFGAFIPATTEWASGLSLETLPSVDAGDGWLTQVFIIHAGHAALQIQIALPCDPEARPDPHSWPQPCIEHVRLCAG